MKNDNNNLFIFLSVAIIIVAGGVAIALLSPQEPDRTTRSERTLAENIQRHEQLTTFAEVLTETGLMEQLENAEEEYTVFAPNDAALAELEEMSDEKLVELVSKHIVEGEISQIRLGRAQTIESIDGQEIQVSVEEVEFEGQTDEIVSVGDATIFNAPEPNNNGLLYVVGAVL